MEVRNSTGYLASRIVFYLMNLHTQHRKLYFARAGRSTNVTFKSDDCLNDEGNKWAKLLVDKLMSFREEENAKELENGEKPRPLIVLPPLHPSTVLSFYTGLIGCLDMDIHTSSNKTNCGSIPPRNQQSCPS